ncbi:MAG: hypothetical protein ACI9NC_002725 [Verrucomicrobiales bacterium]|jgi:hypothetical protein
MKTIFRGALSLFILIFFAGGAFGESSEIERIRAKLKSIVIPKIEFKKATLEEAIEFLRKAAWENDKEEKQPHWRGVPMIYLPGPQPSERDKEIFGEEFEDQITLELTDCRLGPALKFTSKLAGCYPVVTNLGLVVTSPFTGFLEYDKDDPNALEMKRKLRETIIPELDFTDVTIHEAIDFLRLKSGINFVVLPGSDGKRLGRPFITLKLRKIPVGEALDFICQVSGLHWFGVRGHAVVIAPGSAKAPEKE